MTNEANEVNEDMTFSLSPEQVVAVEALSAGRKVRFSGKIVDGKLVVDNIGFANEKFDKAVFAPINAPFALAST